MTKSSIEHILCGIGRHTFVSPHKLWDTSRNWNGRRKQMVLIANFICICHLSFVVLPVCLLLLLHLLWRHSCYSRPTHHPRLLNIIVHPRSSFQTVPYKTNFYSCNIFYKSTHTVLKLINLIYRVSSTSTPKVPSQPLFIISSRSHSIWHYMSVARTM